ncbi:hypothetical protein Bca4012_005347 [Brassica carinata]|uniref:starch synthase n=1 Tax=Brassica carinata TaxID=52824 RepID=A0A8X7RR08_BRACI|nr:hypothetical protein Bca52824_040283 [Brassica carinata]
MDEDQKIIKELDITQDETEGGNLKVVTGNNEAVSHLIYAGSDIMLCLNFLQDQLLQVPLKALKYGTAPIELNPRTGLDVCVCVCYDAEEGWEVVEVKDNESYEERLVL